MELALKRLTALAAALLLIAACSSDRSSSAGTTDSSETTDATDTTDSTSVDTTVPGSETTAATPTTASATTAVATTNPACTPTGDTDPKASADPLLMSSLVGVDIRTGTHPCFERVVIELGGSGGFPGWAVEYVDDPVRLGESDEFVEIAGAATLFVRMGMWMPSMEGDGYAGPIQVFPGNVPHILELRETENFEGMCIWSIGVQAEYPFTVDVLHAPERLVIDIYIPAGG